MRIPTLPSADTLPLAAGLDLLAPTPTEGLAVVSAVPSANQRLLAGLTRSWAAAARLLVLDPTGALAPDAADHRWARVSRDATELEVRDSLYHATSLYFELPPLAGAASRAAYGTRVSDVVRHLPDSPATLVVPDTTSLCGISPGARHPLAFLEPAGAPHPQLAVCFAATSTRSLDPAWLRRIGLRIVGRVASLAEAHFTASRLLVPPPGAFPSPPPLQALQKVAWSLARQIVALPDGDFLAARPTPGGTTYLRLRSAP